MASEIKRETVVSIKDAYLRYARQHLKMSIWKLKRVSLSVY